MPPWTYLGGSDLLKDTRNIVLPIYSQHPKSESPVSAAGAPSPIASASSAGPVGVPPSIQSPVIKTVNPGDRVNIPCSLANPGGSIQFAKDDQPIILVSAHTHTHCHPPLFLAYSWRLIDCLQLISSNCITLITVPSRSISFYHIRFVHCICPRPIVGLWLRPLPTGHIERWSGLAHHQPGQYKGRGPLAVLAPRRERQRQTEDIHHTVGRDK